jgi:putative nucleotidyltransferase with HDIG domain
MVPIEPRTRIATPAETWLLAQLCEMVDSGTIDLPVLPAAAAQVMELCNDSACDAKKLATVLQRDPSLAGHVLRIANSAAFAPREPIVSLQQAISRMGFSNLCQIATAVAVKSKVFAVDGFEDRLREIWFHSATAGAWAKEIARLRRSNVEGAFLSGLLHDVGKPIVMQSAIDLLKAKNERLDPVLLDIAMTALHGKVGAALALKWKLPEFMSAVMLHHHQPEHTIEHHDVVHTVCLADNLAKWSKDGDPARAAEIRKLGVVGELSLYAEEWNTLIAARENVVKVAEAYA